MTSPRLIPEDAGLDLPPGQEREVSVWAFLSLVFRQRRLIAVNFIIVCLATVGVTMLLPNWYRATTTLLPPEKETFNLNLQGTMIAGFPSLGGGFALPFTASPSDVLSAILKSRTVAEAVVKQNQLQERWKTKSLSDAIEKVQRRLAVSVEPQGVISLSFESRNPQEAAEVANSFIVELDQVNQKTSAGKARATRQFIEERLEQTRRDLAGAEDSLKAFQKLHKTVLLDEETKAAVKSAAELKAQITTDEIQLAVLKKTMGSDHPEVQKLTQKIEETRRQLAKIEFGGARSDPKGYLSIPFEKFPDVSLQLAQLMRDLAVQEKVLELLTQQDEQAKIQEKKDTPTVMVLDPAVPGSKVRPRRSLLVVLVGGLSLVASIFYILAAEYFRKLRFVRPEEYSRVAEIKTAVVHDLPLVGRLFNRTKAPFTEGDR